jgi:hypothetical protein
MDRLLILSCSQTKRADAGLLPARQRYNGPLWQTLRCVDPDAQLAQCFALSARYGLLRDDEGIPDYNNLMTRDRAQEMAANPICQAWHRPELPRQLEERGDRWSAGAVLNRTAKPDAGWREVCVVGGHLYLPVAEAIVRDLTLFGHVQPGAPVRVINGEIGNMRAALRAWLVEALALRRAA